MLSRRLETLPGYCQNRYDSTIFDVETAIVWGLSIALSRLQLCALLAVVVVNDDTMIYDSVFSYNLPRCALFFLLLIFSSSLTRNSMFSSQAGQRFLNASVIGFALSQ